MPSYSPQDVQDELLKVIRTSQDTVVEAVKTWVETVKAVTPKVPTPQVPLVEKLLSSQRQFAEDLVKATAPLRSLGGTHEEHGAATE